MNVEKDQQCGKCPPGHREACHSSEWRLSENKVINVLIGTYEDALLGRSLIFTVNTATSPSIAVLLLGPPPTLRKWLIPLLQRGQQGDHCVD